MEKALAFHHAIWLGFDIRQMWTEFVGSLLCPESFFPGIETVNSNRALHRKPTFGFICCDSVWFLVSSISKASVLCA